MKILRQTKLRGIALAAVLVAANFALATEVVQTSYSSFSWTQFAAVYDPTGTPTSTQTPTPTGTPTSTPTITPAESESAVLGGCDDGLDNDENGLVDCADADCNTDPACVVQAPATTPYGLLAVLAGLVIVAVRRIGWQR